MARLVTGLFAITVGFAGVLPAQAPPDAPGVAAVSPFTLLPLSTPTPSRTASGRPGRGYWQQRADYRIAATLDTATRQIRGRETIHYTNNSPDALRYLWLFVEQNICSRAGITE
ncbi:MAG: aminopeptidase, partial [Gemmatimonadales bacterium]